jgi:hypothetical protein
MFKTAIILLIHPSHELLDLTDQTYMGKPLNQSIFLYIRIVGVESH